MSNGITLKKCSCCQEYLTLSEFHRDSSTNDGLNGFCRDCKSSYNKRYRNDRKHNFVYMIIEGREIMYVGSTVNDLIYRISSHINLHSNIRNYMQKNVWTKIVYVSIEEEDITERELRVIEQIMIEEICPSLNQQCASVFNDIEDDRLQVVTELAYHLLDNLHTYCKVYKINYSNRNLDI